MFKRLGKRLLKPQVKSQLSNYRMGAQLAVHWANGIRGYTGKVRLRGLTQN